MKEKKESEKKGVYYVLLLVLTGLIISGFFLYRYQERNHELELHKRLLIERLADAVTEYKFIRTENDSLKEVIENDRRRVLHLMDSVSGITLDSRDKLLSFEQSFRIMKREMNHLRFTVDSLTNVNDSLSRENSLIKDRSLALKDTNKVLQDRLQKSATLKINTFRADAVNDKWNGKEEVTDDNFWTDFFRLCFGAGKNEIARKGFRDVYVRVIKPDNTLMAASYDSLSLANGSKIAYTYEGSFEYKGEAFTECVDIAAEDFDEGKYQVELYYDGALQAVTSLALD